VQQTSIDASAGQSVTWMRSGQNLAPLNGRVREDFSFRWPSSLLARSPACVTHGSPTVGWRACGNRAGTSRR